MALLAGSALTLGGCGGGDDTGSRSGSLNPGGGGPTFDGGGSGGPGDGAVPGPTAGPDAGAPPARFALVTDLNARGAGSSPTILATIGNLTFVAATDAQHGTELFTTDLTQANTKLVSDLVPGPSSSSPKALGVTNGKLVFTITTAPNKTQVWTSDGTSAGTQLALDGSICSGTSAVEMGGALYFCAVTGATPTVNLYKTGGTAATTSVASAAWPSSSMVAMGNALYYDFFNGAGYVLWKYDGNGNGTAVTDGNVAPYALSVLGNKIVFFGQSPSGGSEPWISDGTKAGTTPIADLRPGVPSSIPGRTGTPPVVAGNVAYFLADDGTHGSELWKTDGTAAGTSLVKDISAGATGSNITQLVAMGSKLYFSAHDASGYELWTTDGTEAGTHIVKDIGVGATSGGPLSLTAIGNTLFFAANDGLTGVELWKSDGTEAGTVPVADIFLGPYGSFPTSMRAVGSNVAFACADPQTQPELCVSDGTSANTGIRVRFNVGATADGVTSSIVGGDGVQRLFFTAQTNVVASTFATAQRPSTLWTSDGTESGTVELTSASTAALSAANGQPFVAGGVTYFRGRDQAHGTELWKTDGTAAGTKLVKDIAPGGGSSVESLAPFFAVANKLLFVARSFTTDEIWVSDGTDVGTTTVTSFGPGKLNASGLMVATSNDALYVRAGTDIYRVTPTDVKVVAAGASPISLGFVGQALYWTQKAGDTYELWASDGQATGTKIADLPGTPDHKTGFAPVSGGKVVFIVKTDFDQKAELWTSDGSAAGTTLLRKFVPGSGTGRPFEDQPLAQGALNGVVYFGANDKEGSELWKTDGTAAGTVLVRDINAGSADSKPSHFVVAGGKLYFVAADETTGRELWSTDGTTANTVSCGDLFVGTASSSPSAPVSFGGKLYFTATDAAHGRELWSYDPS